MYRAVMLLNLEVHEEKDNKCSGKIVSSAELAQYGLKSKQLLSIAAENKADLLIKLSNIIKELK